MIKYKYVCDKCGFETEEETTNKRMFTSVPIDSNDVPHWEMIHGFAMCPSCTKKFYDFVKDRIKENSK